jgi:hypothetical protein
MALPQRRTIQRSISLTHILILRPPYTSISSCEESWDVPNKILYALLICAMYPKLNVIRLIVYLFIL